MSISEYKNNESKVIDENIKISIITVCLNSETLIEQTIQSVIFQTYKNIEYLIIDGESSDRTIEIIQKYKTNISIIVSEKDKGIYDAMNKGVRLATGDLIYFLNSGDYLCEKNVLEKIVTRINNIKSYDIIYGDILYYDNDNTDLFSGYRSDIIETMVKGINHQSIFAQKHVFEKYGDFNTNYKIYADFDWLLRLLMKYNVKTIYIDIPVAYYLRGGISETNLQYLFERYDIVRKYINSVQLLKLILLYPKSFCKYLIYTISPQYLYKIYDIRSCINKWLMCYL